MTNRQIAAKHFLNKLMEISIDDKDIVKLSGKGRLSQSTINKVEKSFYKFYNPVVDKMRRLASPVKDRKEDVDLFEESKELPLEDKMLINEPETPHGV